MVTHSHKCNTLEWALGVISMYHVYSRGKGGGGEGANMLLLFVQHLVLLSFSPSARLDFKGR